MTTRAKSKLHRARCQYESAMEQCPCWKPGEAKPGEEKECCLFPRAIKERECCRMLGEAQQEWLVAKKEAEQAEAERWRKFNRKVDRESKKQIKAGIPFVPEKSPEEAILFVPRFEFEPVCEPLFISHDPTAAARTLRKHFTPAQLKQLIHLLQSPDP